MLSAGVAYLRLPGSYLTCSLYNQFDRRFNTPSFARQALLCVGILMQVKTQGLKSQTDLKIVRASPFLPAPGGGCSAGEHDSHALPPESTRGTKPREQNDLDWTSCTQRVPLGHSPWRRPPAGPCWRRFHGSRRSVLRICPCAGRLCLPTLCITDQKGDNVRDTRWALQSKCRLFTSCCTLRNQHQTWKQQLCL